MSENMEDPFATVAETGTVSTTKTKPKTEKKAQEKAQEKEAPTGMDEFLAFVGEMVLDEEDFSAPAPMTSRYIRPAEHTWVPVVITDVKVEQREQRAVVTYTPDGTMVYHPAAIDRLVAEHGAEQSVENVTLYQFVVEAENLAECYGERSSAYRLYSQVFPMRVPFNKPRNRNGALELGFDKSSGKRLLAATRVVKPGTTVREDEDVLNELAAEMIGKSVMARIRYRVKKSDEAIPRKNEDGTPTKALVDGDGSFVVLKEEGDSLIDASGTILDKSDDGLYTYIPDTVGASALVFRKDQLIKKDDAFLIPDNSDDGITVRDIIKRENVYDNLADDVYALPGRTITVQRNDGTESEAEITWDTLGNVAVQPVKAGTMVQAVVAETNPQELITASWLGTHWAETDVPHVLQVDESDGVMRLVSVSLLTGGSDAGLDVFTGDPS